MTRARVALFRVFARRRPSPESVRADLDAYGRSPLVRHDIPVRGSVYDVKTGRVHEVARQRAAGA